MELIRPSSDLRNRYSEISKTCHETREPIYITVNGRGDTVIMGLTDYNQLIAELNLLRDLAEAEDDVINGRVEPIENSFTDIRTRLLKRKT